ncbi:hypothetical protein GDO81_025153 [Engystomops pustulosus]|uniref:Uncharacterized protein n=1 Tax=Engystomops pustulosus TaxID=76066 RepID=A0AAV6YP80_ENGPU|nr:hypothetical protein GDO81_025153 [Engystomops pustulosus]
MTGVGRGHYYYTWVIVGALSILGWKWGVKEVKGEKEEIHYPYIMGHYLCGTNIVGGSITVFGAQYWW